MSKLTGAYYNLEMGHIGLRVKSSKFGSLGSQRVDPLWFRTHSALCITHKSEESQRSGEGTDATALAPNGWVPFGCDFCPDLLDSVDDV